MTNLENDLSNNSNCSKAMEWLLEIAKKIVAKEFQLMFLGFNDSKLTFNKHIEKLCSKLNKQVRAFARLNNYISREQALTVCNAVILSNFNYCPLIWLFCNKGANKEIDHTHKRALRILHKNCESSFETLLARSCSNSIRIKNLQKLMTEIYKSMNRLSPSLV